MYKKTAASSGAQGQPGGPSGDSPGGTEKPKDENVVDAVYEEVDKEKK